MRSRALTKLGTALHHNNMPIKQAAMKALRQTRKRTLRNQKVKEGVQFARKVLRKALDAKEVKNATEATKAAIKAVDKAVQQKVLKRNTAARMKSRMMRMLNTALKAAKG